MYKRKKKKIGRGGGGAGEGSYNKINSFKIMLKAIEIGD